MKNSAKLLLIILLYLIIPNSFSQMIDREKTERALENSLKALDNENDIYEKIRLNHDIGTYYGYLGNQEEVIKYYNRVIEYTETKGIDTIKTYSYRYNTKRKLARLYQAKGNIKKAEKLYKEAFNIILNNYEFERASRMSNPLLYGVQKQLYGQSVAEQKKEERGKAIEDKKKQQENQNTEKDLVEKTKENLNEAKDLVKKKQVKEVITKLEESIKIADDIKQYSYSYGLRINLSNKQALLESYREAIETLNQAFDLSLKNYRDNDAKNVVKLLENYYRLIGESEEDITKIRTDMLDSLNKELQKSESSITKIKYSDQIDSIQNILTSEADSIQFTSSKYYDLIETNKDLQFRNITVTVLAIVLFITIVIVFGGYINQKKQKKLLSQQKMEIEEKNEEINKQNEELNKTLSDYEKAQKVIIRKSQMASLGQLMASIAHEINTPLGSIKSSINTVLVAAKKNRELWPEIVKILPEDQFGLLKEMIDKGLKNINKYNTIQERNLKKQILLDLKEHQNNNNHKLADLLIDTGIHAIEDKYLPIIKNKNIDLILDAAYNANIEIKNGLIIKDAVARVSKILFALKYYSYSTNKETMVKSDIIQGIETVLTLQHKQLKHRIDVIREFEDIPEILCFPEELNQVWINLISNSLHAIKGNGIIIISTSLIDNHIIIRFKDNGTGIPDAIQDKIFEPFFTTKGIGEGTGLGLHIIKDIIEKHHGTITFESQEGIGTTFIINLPLTK